MNIRDIKGLKYPDEYFIKFFFKKGLHNKKNINFLELGSSNGCNLMLPYSFGHNVYGVDLNSTLIEYANYNFKNLKCAANYNFKNQDMREYVRNINYKIDVLVLANSIYYIKKEEFIELLQKIRLSFNENVEFFIRFRTKEDFRFNKGDKIEENTFILNNGITGEDGVLCTFYDKEEMIKILKKELNLADYETMKISYENIQNNITVNNEDIVIWGKIKK